jgi:hypothetical protein
MKECSGQTVGCTDSKEQAGHGESDKRCGGKPQMIAPREETKQREAPMSPSASVMAQFMAEASESEGVRRSAAQDTIGRWDVATGPQLDLGRKCGREPWCRVDSGGNDGCEATGELGCYLVRGGGQLKMMDQA